MLLFKKDTKWKIRELQILAVWDSLVKRSWIEGWKMITHNKTCKPKNVWRKNETTAIEQAELEAKSEIEKKIREWYFPTAREAEESSVVMPMLAKSYSDKIDVDWDNAYVQPKLDWMRCLAVIKEWKAFLFSRKAVPITTMSHIVKELEEASLPNCTLDWELYVHWKTFQENMSHIKKEQKGTEEVKFNVYDLISSSPFTIRMEWLNIVSKLDSVIKVETHRVCCYEEVEVWHSIFLWAGYEGTMLRQWIKSYKKNWRDDQLLKVKDFKDEAFEIIDVVPMDWYEEQWKVVCLMDSWKTFTATPKMSHAEREDLLKNKEDIIWKTAEIRFFEYTDDWKPRFPIFAGVRLDK